MTAKGRSRTGAAHNTAWPVPHGFLRSGWTYAPRQHVQFLKGVVDVDVLRKPAAKRLAEILVDLRANNENELVEAGPFRVIDSEVQHSLAAGADGLHLFQSAVAGADAGGQNDQCRCQTQSAQDATARLRPQAEKTKVS